MASIIKKIELPLPAAAVWKQVREVGNAQLLFPGVVSACVLQGDERTVTFSNGVVLKERILSVDEESMRVAYSATGGRATHHNSSLRVVPLAADRCRVVWTTDFLPDDITPLVEGLCNAGLTAMKRQLTTLSAPAQGNA